MQIHMSIPRRPMIGVLITPCLFVPAIGGSLCVTVASGMTGTPTRGERVKVKCLRRIMMNGVRSIGMTGLIGLLLTTCLVEAAQDSDPSVAGKKAAEWLAILQGDKEAKRRRAALIVLEVFGPAGRGVL